MKRFIIILAIFTFAFIYTALAAENTVIDLLPEYTKKQAVLMRLPCNKLKELRFDTARQSIETKYLYQIVAYTLTRSDVYLEICDEVTLTKKMNIIENIADFSIEDIIPINSEKNFLTKLLQETQIKKVDRGFKKYITNLFSFHQDALKNIGGHTHTIFVASKKRDLYQGVHEYMWFRNFSIFPVRVNGEPAFVEFGSFQDEPQPFQTWDQFSSKYSHIPIYYYKNILLDTAKIMFDGQRNLWISESVIKKNIKYEGESFEQEKEKFLAKLDQIFVPEDIIVLKNASYDKSEDLDTIVKLVWNEKLGKTEALLSVANVDYKRHYNTTPNTNDELFYNQTREHIDTYNRETLLKKEIDFHEIQDNGFKILNAKVNHVNTYTNSLILDKDTVLIPWFKGFHQGTRYNEQANAGALNLYKKFYKHVVQIPMPSITGSIHCLTIDIPAGW